MNILLIEDNASIIKGLKYSFEKEGFSFFYESKVRGARKFLAENAVPHLIILDVSLPDGDGFSLYSEVIKPMGIPVIFLTAKDDEEDIVKGLTLGAEDYMTKPFSTKELMLRVKKRIFKVLKEKEIKLNDLTYYKDKSQVYKGDMLLDFSPIELRLFDLLLVNRCKVVTRTVILDKIWEWTGNFVDDHTVTVYIKRIREKVGEGIITTVKGVGYIIDAKE